MSWVYIFFVGIGFFFVFHYHYLFLLIGMEFLLLSLFYGFSCGSMCCYFSGMLGFLVLLVCMGGFSLSLLVFLSRALGAELFLFF